MPNQAARAPQAALDIFRQKISAARRPTGWLQKNLAEAMGLNAHVLSHKLHGTDGARLTHPEVKQIIKTLASWEAITTQDEALELLALMGLKKESFTTEEWGTAPLDQLEPTAPVPAPLPAPWQPPPRRAPAIPAPLAPLIGRDELVELVCQRLRQPEVRLLTLLGPGGVGKTRVGLAVARQLQADFADGVYVVALAPVRDPAWVPSAIAQALGLAATTPESGTRTYADLVPAFLADKQLLLVLDNLEQVLGSTPFLARLLAAAPALQLLVTSRAVLYLSGEHVIGVPPLALPDPHHLPDRMALARFPAIRLFVERAQMAQASFRLTEQNAPAVAQICQRLDGLPLAIELAAVRIRLFSPHALLARLDSRLDLLAGGPRDLPARQQTLRATLAWSYELLSEPEQALFRRLAVFVGGCTLEAIEALSAALGEASDTLLGMVESLLDQSLIQSSGSDEPGVRLGMLETIREYGTALLRESGEYEATQRAHAAYYLNLAEAAEPHLRGVAQRQWLTQLEDEHENLRASLEWLLQQAGAQPNPERAEEALRLCAALFWFWYLHGHVVEGQTFLGRALATDAGTSSTVRAYALYVAGELAFYTNADYRRIETRCQESLALFRELGDARGEAESLYLLGTVAWAQSDFSAAHAQLEEALRLFQQVDDSWGTANTLIRLGRLCLDQGACAQAIAFCEQGLALFRTLADPQRTGYALCFLARALFVAQADQRRARALAEESLALLTPLGNRQMSTHAACFLAEMLVEQGDAAAARALAEESVAVHREMADQAATAQTLFCLARIAAAQGDLVTAQRHYEESLTCARAITYQPLLAASLEGLGEVVAAHGAPVRAAQLWGKAAALRQGMGAALYPLYRAVYEQAVAVTRAQLGEERFTAACDKGRAMTVEQAMTYTPDEVS